MKVIYVAAIIDTLDDNGIMDVIGHFKSFGDVMKLADQRFNERVLEIHGGKDDIEVREYWVRGEKTPTDLKEIREEMTALRLHSFTMVYKGRTNPTCEIFLIVDRDEQI